MIPLAFPHKEQLIAKSFCTFCLETMFSGWCDGRSYFKYQLSNYFPLLFIINIVELRYVMYLNIF